MENLNMDISINNLEESHEIFITDVTKMKELEKP